MVTCTVCFAHPGHTNIFTTCITDNCGKIILYCFIPFCTIYVFLRSNFTGQKEICKNENFLMIPLVKHKHSAVFFFQTHQWNNARISLISWHQVTFTTACLKIDNIKVNKKLCNRLVLWHCLFVKRRKNHKKKTDHSFKDYNIKIFGISLHTIHTSQIIYIAC